MTPEVFRSLVLALPRARHSERLGNLAFTADEKAFATLGSPNAAWATLKLSKAEQARAMATAPMVFSPQPGGPGARGWTCVRLADAEPKQLQPFLQAAHRSAASPLSARSSLRPAGGPSAASVGREQGKQAGPGRLPIAPVDQ